MAVFEVSGVWAKAGKDNKPVWLHAREVGDDEIMIDATYSGASMTVEQARRFAAQLYRLARRVEKRNEGTTK